MSYYIQLSSTNLYAHVAYRSNGYSVRCVKDDDELIPVEKIILDAAAVIYAGPAESFTLNVAIYPANANHQSIHWYSDNSDVVVTDGQCLTAVNSGMANLTAMVGMQTATCQVMILPK